jgi:DNA-binding NarL/FixJ family response regulator
VTLRSDSKGPPIADPHDPAPRIRVGLVDDHPSVLAAVAAAVEATDDLALVGTARTTDDALRLAADVDVLVCDVQLDGHAEGLWILEALHDPRTGAGRSFRPPAVIFLSGFQQPSLVRAAIERGAAGFLDKSSELDGIIAAVRTVASGGTVYTAAALQQSRTARRRPSDRELEVIDLVTAGSTNAEVAAVLGLSERTVESHLRRLFDRYGLLSRVELAVLALDEGWTADRRQDP